MSFSENLPPIQPHWRWLLLHPAYLISFGFGSGLAPRAPGTIGSLWAWALGLLIYYGINPNPFFSFIGLFFGFLIGLWACGQTGKDLHQPDHSGMVWDEIIAFWLVLVFVLPASFWIQLLAFVLFRIFDALKPGPIKTIDLYFKSWTPASPLAKKWELFIRGFGVMIDDLAAALATLFFVAILQRVFL